MLSNPFSSRDPDSMWRISMHYPIEDRNLLNDTLLGQERIPYSAVLGTIFLKFINEYKRLHQSGASRAMLEHFVSTYGLIYSPAYPDGDRTGGGLPNRAVGGTPSETSPPDDPRRTSGPCSTPTADSSGLCDVQGGGGKNRRRKASSKGESEAAGTGGTES